MDILGETDMSGKERERREEKTEELKPRRKRKSTCAGETDRISKEVTFEDGLARLDEIIHALENENIPLSSLMSLYEEGVSLLRECNDRLDHAEQKVKILRISENGTKAHMEDFLPADEAPVNGVSREENL